jgi:hypothetical protein
LSVEAGAAERYLWCVEDRHSWLPPGLESSGLEPDDRASQRRDRKREERKANQPDEPKVSRTSGDEKPRKLRGRRDWKPLDEPDSGASEAKRQRKPEKVAAATGGGGVADDESRAESRPAQDESDERDSGERRDDDSRNGHGPSDTDAMGQDKRRQVIGQRYGASRARQFAYYGIFVAFLVAIYIGGQAAVSHFDKAPKHDKAQAPWAKANAPDEPLGGFEPRKAGQKGPTRFP